MEESAINSFKENNMFKDLMDLKTEKSVKEFIEKYGKEWKWNSIGGKENAGIIDMGSEPSDALAERITNGMDALIERKFFDLGKPSDAPKSPREASEKWFNVPRGDLARLNDKQRRKLAENLTITLLESGENFNENPNQWKQVTSSPTIEIRDKGIGQHPDKFKKSFVSLNEDNKMGMHFLIGAFGQGGSTVYGFGNYAIILSRRPASLIERGQTDFIGWTIIRRNERDYEQFKKAIYEYCVSPEDFIMRFSPNVTNDNFEGSIVRLVQFELPREATIYTAPTSSLWWLTHHCLFDPVIPFLIFDSRKKRFPLKDEAITTGKVINGNRYRLNAKNKKTGESKYPSNFWEISLVDMNGGKVIVIWWICENKKEVENFVNRSQPVVISFNGQRQILISKSELNLKGRDFIKDRLVVQVIGDLLSSEGQRIFSSTRDRARKNKVYSELLHRLRKALIDDEELRQIDQEIREKTLSKATDEQESKAMELLAKLLEREEKIDERAKKIFTDDIYLPVTSTPKEEEKETEEEEEKEPEKIRPIPEVQLNNIPTKLEILNAKSPIIVEKGYGTLLKIFTDVVDNYFTREENGGELILEFQQQGIVLEKARSNLRKGKVSIRIEAIPEIEKNTRCQAKITVTKPNGDPLSTDIIFEIESPKKRWRLKSGKKEKMKPKGPEIKIIGKEDETWKTLEWDEKDVAEFKDKVVYVSKDNRFVAPCLKAIKGEETLRRYLTRYAAHMALFTILQKRYEESIKQELPENYRRSEMERAARAIIRAVAINIEELEEIF